MSADLSQNSESYFGITVYYVWVVIFIVLGILIFYKYRTSQNKATQTLPTQSSHGSTNNNGKQHETSDSHSGNVSPNSPQSMNEKKRNKTTRMFGDVIINPSQRQATPRQTENTTLSLPELVQTNKNKWVVLQVNPATREIINI